MSIRAAVEALKASREALPNWANRWQSRGVIVESGGSWPIAEVRDMERSDTPRSSKAVAAHIALTASPDVTEVLEQLLEAHAAVADAMADVEPTPASAALRARNVGQAEARAQRAALALAAAVTRTSRAALEGERA